VADWIDTNTNSVLGWVPVLNCTSSSCPSSVLVVPDLQKLVVTNAGSRQRSAAMDNSLKLAGVKKAPLGELVSALVDEVRKGRSL
jgi:DNA-binding beta-propeller fold protein YncE